MTGCQTTLLFFGSEPDKLRAKKLIMTEQGNSKNVHYNMLPVRARKLLIILFWKG